MTLRLERDLAVLQALADIADWASYSEVERVVAGTPDGPVPWSVSGRLLSLYHRTPALVESGLEGRQVRYRLTAEGRRFLRRQRRLVS